MHVLFVKIAGKHLHRVKSYFFQPLYKTESRLFHFSNLFAARTSKILQSIKDMQKGSTKLNVKDTFCFHRVVRAFSYVCLLLFIFPLKTFTIFRAKDIPILPSFIAPSPFSNEAHAKRFKIDDTYGCLSACFSP